MDIGTTGGQVGGVEANLKRWYGQFKQPDGGNTEEKALIKNSKINNLDLTTVEVSGTYLFQPNMMSGETFNQVVASPNLVRPTNQTHKLKSIA